MSKLTYSEIANKMRETSSLSMQTYGSFSRCCGVYEALLADLVAELPSHKQQEFMKILQQTA